MALAETVSLIDSRSDEQREWIETCADACRQHDAQHSQVSADVLKKCAESCCQMADA